MALDGVFLSLVASELRSQLIGARVDKIHQPSKESIVISFRTQGFGNKKVLISASAGGARVHFTSGELENPQVPPMFCMLLRKHLSSGKVVEIAQDGFERILNIVFEATDEFGDKVTLTLACEIMGRCSNIVLVSQSGRVVDSIKRVTNDMSSVRVILPGTPYSLPPKVPKMSIFGFDETEFKKELTSQNADTAKALVRIFEGISPILAREAQNYACRGEEKPTLELTADEQDRLSFYFKKTALDIASGANKYTIIKEKSGKMRDFCFVNISQYGALATEIYCDTPSALLEKFYTERDILAQTKQRADDLFKLLLTLTERTKRRVAVQKEELKETANREELRLKGDLIMSNLYRIQKGDSSATVENFYSENCESITISLDKRLTPAQNATKYYSEYRKADNAEKMLVKLIEQGEQEEIYLNSVFDSLSRASTEAELLEIRAELEAGGYLKHRTKNAKKVKALPPLEYTTSQGYKVLVGRNNRQNDTLTFKIAEKSDIWLHVQSYTGSHAVILAQNTEVPIEAIEEAAVIAAYNSSARGSSSVPVDYTLCRFVKKPAGAKPGMVIFTNNKTLFVTAEME